MAVPPLSLSILFPQVDRSDAHGEFAQRMPAMPGPSGDLSGYAATEPAESDADDDLDEDAPAIETHASTENQASIVIDDAVQAARRRLTHDLDCMDQTLWDGASLDDLLAHIAAERLARMPHNGSSWDKTLKDAESFAVHTSQYLGVLNSFVPQSSMAAELVWVLCRLLLEVNLRFYE